MSYGVTEVSIYYLEINCDNCNKIKEVEFDECYPSESRIAAWMDENGWEFDEEDSDMTYCDICASEMERERIEEEANSKDMSLIRNLTPSIYQKRLSGVE